MERIRVGLTGLGLVLLVVFIAAAGMRPTRPVATANGLGETLSTLGVAPSQDQKPGGEVAARKFPAKPQTDPRK